MKRILFIATTLLVSFAANAQDEPRSFDPFTDRGFLTDTLHITATLMVIILIAAFILTVMRYILDNRVKNKMIEKGVPENIVSQYLQPAGNKDSKSTPIKWFTMLTGIGIGLMLVKASQPIGLHSLAIMAFSIAAGFLGYYFFIRQNEK